jgi:hypothetical protein
MLTHFCYLLPETVTVDMVAGRKCCALSPERVYHAGQYMSGSVQKSCRLLRLFNFYLLSSSVNLFSPIQPTHRLNSKEKYTMQQVYDLVVIGAGQ